MMIFNIFKYLIGIIYIFLLASIQNNNLIGQSNDELIVFSNKHGFYYEPFSLVISCNLDGVLLYYTIDGSNPINSKNAKIVSSPISLSVNPNNRSDRDIAPGFIVRVCALLNGNIIGKIHTQTYLFPEKIIELSPDNQIPGPGWLAQGEEHYINYGLDPDIYNDPEYSSDIQEAFLSIPTLSLVTDLGSLFDPDSGIYVNPFKRGIEWERFSSLELLNIDGTQGFQINGGLRIRGGWSRRPINPKHAFRFSFREKYDSVKLNFPLFGNEGANEFDNIDLRTSQNYSWAYEGDASNTFLRDVFSRDTQKDMKQPYTRSRFYHLYINGTYWGLYQTQERSEASYAESYFGGDKSDYDVVKVDFGEEFYDIKIEATDGTLDKWRELWEVCQNGLSNNEQYLKIQGMNIDGTPNPNYEKLLDVNNLIDYMIVTFFVGDFDGPVSAWRNNESPNNFYAIINRVNPDGFKFFRHDAEHSLFNNEWGIDRTGPYPAGEMFLDSNPQWIHQQLSANLNYRIRFADRVYKHFYNNGALTIENITQRINERKAQIETAIIAESARWGDSKRSTPYSKSDWNNAIDYIFNDFLPERQSIVLNQLVSKGLYYSSVPPEFNIPEGVVEKGTEVELHTPTGIIYYTIDGNDPVLPINNTILSSNKHYDLTNSSISKKTNSKLNSVVLKEASQYSISPSAILYEHPIQIEETTTIKARTLINDEWSVLTEAKFMIDEDLTLLKITELHYHPLASINNQDTIKGKEFEFIELKNISFVEQNLTGSFFDKGISYEFAKGSVLLPNKFIVLASNSEEFKKRYGFTPFGEYRGHLDNSGEQVVLKNAANRIVFSFSYDDKSPWPTEADGEGYSLVVSNQAVNGDPNNYDYWRLSTKINGSPGSDDFLSTLNDEVNIIMDHFSLYQNYPNPFNPSTIIKYSIPSASVIANGVKQSQEITSVSSFPRNDNINVILKIYDILGREVETLVNQKQKPGNYEVIWDASNNPSGIYFYRFSAGEFVQTKKMLLIK